MKKIMLGIVGAVLIITVSAFTMTGNLPAEQTQYYWYEVVDGFAKHAMPINGGNPISKQDLEANAATLLPCELGSQVDCVRGFTQPLLADADTGESDRIQKD